jgi:crotonobetainyl-CoA:carnitine CoA-transferase CaiB-like acyl-CoA transferase
MAQEGTATVPNNSLPLQGVRVVDLTDGVTGVAARYLADLGADVVLVEPPDGVPSRRSQPRHARVGLRFATAHYNKRGVVADLSTEAGRDRLLRLTDGADLVLESHPPGWLAGLGVGQQVMRARNPRLAVVSITPFGQTGPYRDWKASGPVLAAMSSLLTRSGAPNREPLLPPGELISESAALHCAFVALLGYLQAQRTGQGDYADCSLFDLAVKDFDPGFGMAGTATLGRPLVELAPGRPDVRMMYPILPCADGHVRMFVASPKQWRALWTWLGEPEEFADPSFDHLFTRLMQWSNIRPAIEALFADKTRAEIVGHGSSLGIAVAALHTPEEILHSDHVRERGSFLRAEIAPGIDGALPSGFVELDGKRAGFRHRAPELGEHTNEVLTEPPHRAPTVSASAAVGRPLEGVRVLDLGVIVVGAETGRALADQGADVIKVENRAFLDGARQFDTSEMCSYSFAIGNRGKRSLGLDLRSETGKALCRRLVAESDVVLTNFKPGTAESLGVDYETMRRINPRIIAVDSSAMGNAGPWSRQMGYGPLVRATVGLTTLWRHPDSPDAFGDDMTVYPDHAASRVAIVAVLAALIERTRTGVGRKISVAQMETVFGQLATDYLRESLEFGSMIARGNVGEFDAPSGVYACTGEDAYCAVTVDGDEQWRNLAAVIGRPDLAADPDYATAAGRVTHRAVLDTALQEWIAPLTPRDAQNTLQAAGVPAGAAVHVKDLLDDPHLSARRQLGLQHQPGYPEPLHVEVGPAVFENLPEPELRPAPLMAADTREVCRTVLGMGDAEIDELHAAGVLEIHDTAAHSAYERT